MAMVPTLYGLEVAPVAPKHWCYGIDSVKERVIRNYFSPPPESPPEEDTGPDPPCLSRFWRFGRLGFWGHGRRRRTTTKPPSPQTPFLRTGNRNGTRISISVFLRFQPLLVIKIAKKKIGDKILAIFRSWNGGLGGAQFRPSSVRRRRVR